MTKTYIYKVCWVKLFAFALLLLFNQACCTQCDELIEENNSELVANYMAGLQLEDAAKQTGTPPTSNQNLEYSIDSNGYAFNNEGFDLTISSDAPLAGYYLQVKRGDAISEDYYNVQLDVTSSKEPVFSSLYDRLLGQADQLRQKSLANSYQVDIDFNEGLSLDPNTAVFQICFLITPYNGTGNISEPKEICYDHHGWGNDFALTGLWDLTQYEERENDTLTTVAIGELVCEEACYSIEFQNILFSEDGTFELEIIEYEYENQDIDFTGRYQENYTGKWFKDDSNKLFLAVYTFRAINNDTQVENVNLGLGGSEFVLIQQVQLLPDEFQPNQINLKYDSSYIEFYEKPKTL